MKPQRIFNVILLLFVVVSIGSIIWKETRKQDTASPAESVKSEIPDAVVVNDKDAVVADQVLVVYFLHGRARCKSCKIIEAFGKKALEEGFPDEMKSGRIIWRDIDMDEPENKHFVQDYQIISISLVLSDTEGGEQKRWKNLDEVWNLFSNESAFVGYVQEEVKAFLK